jgi:GT2 family glycosyltransferase/glycosyltransferase involved in cell wall biosynthesis
VSEKVAKVVGAPLWTKTDHVTPSFGARRDNSGADDIASHSAHQIESYADSLTILVVTYNSERHIERLSRSLPDALSGLRCWRLHVVDNDSQDATLSLVREHMPMAAVTQMGRNAGYAAAINSGMRASASPGPILVLNPDVELGEKSVPRLLMCLQDDGVGIAVPQIRNANGTVFRSLRKEPAIHRVWAEAILGGRNAARLGLSEVVDEPSGYGIAQDVDWATGAVMIISAACREALGDWDESFFLYSEEVDYCRRARDAGFRVRYLPSAVARHVGGEYEASSQLWRILVRSRARYYRKYHSAVAAAAFQAGLAAHQLIRASSSSAHRAAVRDAVRRYGESVSRSSSNQHSGGFIWFAAQDWWYHNQAHSDFQLMKEVARTRPVLVVNSIGLRVPRKGVSTTPLKRILRKVRSTAKLVRRPLPDNPGYHVMTPLLLPFYGDTIGARLNAWLIRQQVRAVASVLGLGREPAIGITIPTAWPVARRMRCSALIYNRSDLLSAFPEANNSWVHSLEERLLRHSDRVLYVSHELMRRDHHVVGQRGYFLDHGVDLDHFTSGSGHEISHELSAIKRPRIGFFGGLDDYVVDMELLKITASALPDMQFVLIGDATCPMDDLTSLPNVHWLGYRPYEMIPSLGRGFDVALMPWLDNEWIRYANPIKLKEYLALGLPVVTTEYPEIEPYRSSVHVAKTRSEFPDLVRAALAHPGDSASRRSRVLDASWQFRARTLEKVADSVGLD